MKITGSVFSFSLFFLVLTLNGCGGGDTPTSNDTGYTSIGSGIMPDSGQTSCFYDYTDDGFYNPTKSACFSGGLGPDGQDGSYSINTMSFTDNGDGTILDDITGLTWQKCTIGHSGSDCSIGTGTGYSWNDAKIQCANLNLAGTGWRLPTVFELTQIVNYGSSVTIDSAAFPSTFSNYWSSTAHSTQAWAWYVNFSQNGIAWAHYQTQLYNVRCIR